MKERGIRVDRYNRFGELKLRLDSYRPLPREVVENLRDDLILRWTYNSNAIEGNTLTLKETKVALEGITVGGKTLQEHLEAINHKDAIVYLEALLKAEEGLTERNIKSIHQLILKKIDDKNAGAYRKMNVLISGAEHIPIDAAHVDEAMNKFLNWYNSDAQSLHPVERAMIVHLEFVKIHPFIDGNGRSARLLMNFELMRCGFPPIVLPVEKRLEYYEALDTAHTKDDTSLFFDLIVPEVENAFDKYWYALGISG